ncbi:hypothetical protein BDR04DRAFT_1120095 [Suillus decipiens]|nr:hypothetical protein BDR04DRAFT_1120095 [Suillus decipiens]
MRECDLGWEEGVWRSRGGRWGRTCGEDVFQNSQTVDFENGVKISGAWVEVDEGYIKTRYRYDRGIILITLMVADRRKGGFAITGAAKRSEVKWVFWRRRLRMARKDGTLDGVDGADSALLSDVRRISGRGLLLLDIEDRDVRVLIIPKPGDRSAIVSAKMKNVELFQDECYTSRGGRACVACTLRRPASGWTASQFKDAATTTSCALSLVASDEPTTFKKIIN